jgi:hypothetical protein
MQNRHQRQAAAEAGIKRLEKLAGVLFAAAIAVTFLTSCQPAASPSTQAMAIGHVAAR